MSPEVGVMTPSQYSIIIILSVSFARSSLVVQPTFIKLFLLTTICDEVQEQMPQTQNFCDKSWIQL